MHARAGGHVLIHMRAPPIPTRSPSRARRLVCKRSQRAGSLPPVACFPYGVFFVRALFQCPLSSFFFFVLSVSVYPDCIGGRA